MEQMLITAVPGTRHPAVSAVRTSTSTASVPLPEAPGGAPPPAHEVLKGPQFELLRASSAVQVPAPNGSISYATLWFCLK